LPGFDALSSSHNRKAPLFPESDPGDCVAQNFDVSQFHFQREALMHGGEGDNYAALMAELRHDALGQISVSAK
jgi:hypothetical protein